jgi:hypothetical protein
VTLEALADTAIADWCSAVRDAYKFAKGDRLALLNGEPQRRFDARGLHPYSELVGRARALEAVFPPLRELDLDVLGLRRAGEEDALVEWEAEREAAWRLRATLERTL